MIDLRLYGKQKIQEPVPRTVSISEAGEILKAYMIEAANPEWTGLFDEAKSGIKGTYDKCLAVLMDILNNQKLTIQDYSPQAAAEEIFRVHYGLKELDQYYKDPDIDEMQVLPNGQIWVTCQGKSISTDIIYNESEKEEILARLTPVSDVGVSLDEGSPTMELVRPDGFRLTASCKPVTRGRGLVLRKHGNFLLEMETFVAKNTFDHRVGEMLKLFARGLRNILICGGGNSGKTTLLKWLALQLPSHLSICVLETDNELRLADYCPERKIWELEAHPEIKGADIGSLFPIILRISPNVVLTPEFRGTGEVWVAIESCTRGHAGMATAHYTSFASIEEVIRNAAMLAVQEKTNLPLEIVIERVAQAFQIVIQTYWDSSTGIRKVTNITEVIVDNGLISYNPLVTWEPATEDYTGEGKWQIIGRPSDKCFRGMQVYGVKQHEIQAVWGDVF